MSTRVRSLVHCAVVLALLSFSVAAFGDDPLYAVHQQGTPPKWYLYNPSFVDDPGVPGQKCSGDPETPTGSDAPDTISVCGDPCPAQFCLYKASACVSGEPNQHCFKDNAKPVTGVLYRKIRTEFDDDCPTDTRCIYEKQAGSCSGNAPDCSTFSS